jgi:WD40 repeat protein
MDAHPNPIHTICHLEDNNIIATGDDDGLIRIWDLRMASKGKKHAIAMEFDDHEGTISKMDYKKDSKMIVSAAHDGMLGVFDLRMKKLYAMSDHFEDDLTDVVIMKHGKKVLVASSEGVVNIFSWDWFGDSNDRLVGHPGAIDTMVKYDEDTIITGCEDGLIRALSVLPNKIISILGDPMDAEDEVFHISKVTLSHDKKLLASTSLDDMVRIIDVSHLASRHKEKFDDDQYEASIALNLKANHGKVDNPEARKGLDGEEDWDDDSDEDSDEDSGMDDSSDDDGKSKKQPKKDKKLNPKNPSLNATKKMIDDHKKKEFFEDL